jgi:CubicO group peptidase (beta-lactamase class C family)
VGLLAGVALDEGKIHSLDDPVSRYIPVYTKGMQANTKQEATELQRLFKTSIVIS